MRAQLHRLASLLFLALTATQVAQAQQQPSAQVTSRQLNQSTIGFAAGQPEGAPLRFATELARVLDDGDRMRVLPVVTRGPFENVNDLLYLRGIDAAIIYGDALEHFKKDPALAGIERRINYLTLMFPSEVHIFVRPEIKTLQDLAGKRVNFNTKGTAAAYSGPIILERLGIKVDARFDPHPVAMAAMARSDAYAATFWVSTKPLDPFLKQKWPEGFKFLPLPMNEKLEEYYLPAQLDSSDYPALIPAGQRIQTISVPAVLAVFAWPQKSDRHERMVRFIDYLFDRLPRLQSEPGYHPRWKDINLAATVPGWQRYQPMQQKLDSVSRAGQPIAVSSAGGERKTAPRAMPSAMLASLPAAMGPLPSPPAGPGARAATAGLTEPQARSLLKQAGFEPIGTLALDDRKLWRGNAVKGASQMRVAVDNRGNIYSRKLVTR